MKISNESPAFELRVERPSLEPKGNAPKASFAETLTAIVDDAREATAKGDADAEGLIAGRVEIHQAMVSMEKADLVLRMGTTVRNKLLEAYQQLMQSSQG